MCSPLESQTLSLFRTRENRLFRTPRFILKKCLERVGARVHVVERDDHVVDAQLFRLTSHARERPHLLKAHFSESRTTISK